MGGLLQITDDSCLRLLEEADARELHGVIEANRTHLAGTMTAAVRLLVDHALTVWRLNRVEIIVATGNRRSRAIPERLGREIGGYDQAALERVVANLDEACLVQRLAGEVIPSPAALRIDRPG
jgi:hypothetical protein